MRHPHKLSLLCLSWLCSWTLSGTLGSAPAFAAPAAKPPVARWLTPPPAEFPPVAQPNARPTAKPAKPTSRPVPRPGQPIHQPTPQRPAAPAPTRPAPIKSLGGSPYENLFFAAIKDKLLDRREYAMLQLKAGAYKDPVSQHLAGQLLPMLAGHKAPIQFQLAYPRASGTVQLDFLFEPLYAEDDLIQGRTIPEFLSRVSQGDDLPETKEDSNRCGAAAVLAGHLLVYGDLSLAFRKLGLANSPLTYRKLHTAQERLYTRANTDRLPGLAVKISYQQTSKGLVAQQAGETDLAAKLVGLKTVLFKSTLLEDKTARQREIAAFWQKNPRVPLMLGSHLDTQTGELSGTDKGSNPDNHAIVLFKYGSGIWLYNSGVRENGGHAAARQIGQAELNKLLFNSSTAVFALFRGP